MTDAERDFAQQATEEELVDLVARLVRAAADNRGHTPSRKAAHGVCVHCAAARQGSAFVAMMREHEEEEPIVDPVEANAARGAAALVDANGNTLIAGI